MEEYGTHLHVVVLRWVYGKVAGNWWLSVRHATAHHRVVRLAQTDQYLWLNTQHFCIKLILQASLRSNYNFDFYLFSFLIDRKYIYIYISFVSLSCYSKRKFPNKRGVARTA